MRYFSGNYGTLYVPEEIVYENDNDIFIKYVTAQYEPYTDKKIWSMEVEILETGDMLKNTILYNGKYDDIIIDLKSYIKNIGLVNETEITINIKVYINPGLYIDDFSVYNIKFFVKHGITLADRTHYCQTHFYVPNDVSYVQVPVLSDYEKVTTAMGEYDFTGVELYGTDLAYVDINPECDDNIIINLGEEPEPTDCLHTTSWSFNIDSIKTNAIFFDEAIPQRYLLIPDPDNIDKYTVYNQNEELVGYVYDNIDYEGLLFCDYSKLISIAVNFMAVGESAYSQKYIYMEYNGVYMYPTEVNFYTDGQLGWWETTVNGTFYLKQLVFNKNDLNKVFFSKLYNPDFGVVNIYNSNAMKFTNFPNSSIGSTLYNLVNNMITFPAVIGDEGGSIYIFVRNNYTANYALYNHFTTGDDYQPKFFYAAFYYQNPDGTWGQMLAMQLRHRYLNNYMAATYRGQSYLPSYMYFTLDNYNLPDYIKLTEECDITISSGVPSVIKYCATSDYNINLWTNDCSKWLEHIDDEAVIFPSILTFNEDSQGTVNGLKISRYRGYFNGGCNYDDINDQDFHIIDTDQSVYTFWKYNLAGTSGDYMVQTGNCCCGGEKEIFYYDKGYIYCQESLNQWNVLYERFDMCGYDCNDWLWLTYTNTDGIICYLPFLITDKKYGKSKSIYSIMYNQYESKINNHPYAVNNAFNVEYTISNKFSNESFAEDIIYASDVRLYPSYLPVVISDDTITKTKDKTEVKIKIQLQK